jgi:hypothetical protein
MRLESADALLRYLFERELVSRASVIDGEIVILSNDGHHRIVDRRGGQLFAVRGAEAVARQRVVHGVEDMRALLPEIVVDEDDLLLTRTFDKGLDAAEHQRTIRRVADWLPAAAGSALARWHRAAAPFAGDARLHRDLPPPFRPSPNAVAPQVAQAIARAGAEWRPATIAHGDFSFEAIYIASESDHRIHLGRWHEVRAGDAAWDVAGIIESYYAWSIDPSTIKAVDGPVTNVGGVELRSLVVAFWTAYAGAAALPPAEARALLLRAFAYAGVRMLARIERVMNKPESAPSLTRMMQAAMAMLTTPATVADAFVSPPAPPQWPQAWMAR